MLSKRLVAKYVVRMSYYPLTPQIDWTIQYCYKKKKGDVFRLIRIWF